MIEHTQYVDDIVDDISQYVTPYASIKFFDNRFLKNLTVDSSNTSYEESILNLKPRLFWSPKNETFIADKTDNKNDGISTGGLQLGGAGSFEPVYSLKRVQDNFNRANTDNGLGLASDGTATAPYIIDFNRARWRIASNKCVAGPTLSSYNGTKPDYALVETGGSNGYISAKFSTITANQGLIFRYIDDKNFCMFRVLADASLQIVQVINGAVDPTYTRFTFLGVAQADDIFKINFHNGTYSVERKRGSDFFVRLMPGASEAPAAPVFPLKFDDFIAKNGTKHGLVLFSNITTAAQWDELDIECYASSQKSLYRDRPFAGFTGTNGNVVCNKINNLSFVDNYSILCTFNLSKLDTTTGRILTVKDSNANENFILSFN